MYMKVSIQFQAVIALRLRKPPVYFRIPVTDLFNQIPHWFFSHDYKALNDYAIKEMENLIVRRASPPERQTEPLLPSDKQIQLRNTQTET